MELARAQTSALYQSNSMKKLATRAKQSYCLCPAYLFTSIPCARVARPAHAPRHSEGVQAKSHRAYLAAPAELSSALLTNGFRR